MAVEALETVTMQVPDGKEENIPLQVQSLAGVVSEVTKEIKENFKRRDYDTVD